MCERYHNVAIEWVGLMRAAHPKVQFKTTTGLIFDSVTHDPSWTLAGTRATGTFYAGYKVSAERIIEATPAPEDVAPAPTMSVWDASSAAPSGSEVLSADMYPTIGGTVPTKKKASSPQ